MKHIKIILVPDQRYPGPAGCKPCYYMQGGNCRDTNLAVFGKCMSEYHGGVYLDGGHYTIKASVSRNKREGKYDGKKYGRHWRAAWGNVGGRHG